MNRILRLAPIVALPLLGACDLVVLNPAGDVARQQANLILWSTGLMLLIVVPVMILTIVFAWRYRAKGGKMDGAENFRADWDHSTILELAIWSAPLLIVIALGALTWVSTHTLDPYRPLGRIAAGRPIPAGQRPLEVQVVALDWKWLFIYPEQGIATVNELVVPVDRQVRFRLTSSSVMNTFYVPAMAGMIYTMPGMETKLHAVLNRPGTFEGVSANYSGAGFSDMRFPTLAVDATGFDRWAAMVKGGGRRLGQREYIALEKPSEKVPAMRFGAVDPALFGRIVQMCVRPGQRCMSGDMHGKGAMEKAPGELGTSPHMSAPHGGAGGKGSPGDDSNRNMTRLDAPAIPGVRTTARS